MANIRAAIKRDINVNRLPDFVEVKVNHKKKFAWLPKYLGKFRDGSMIEGTKKKIWLTWYEEYRERFYWETHYWVYWEDYVERKQL